MPSTICILYLAHGRTAGMRMMFIDKDRLSPAVLVELKDMMIVDEDAGNDYFDDYLTDPDYAMDEVNMLKRAHQRLVDIMKSNPPIPNMVPHNASHAKVMRVQFRETQDDTKVNSNHPSLHVCLMQTYINKVRKFKRNRRA